MAAGSVGGVTTAAGRVPNNHFHRRTSAPSRATSTGAGGGVGASGTGIGMRGAAEAGRMLGTNGASLCTFLSRLPIFESSRTGWSAIR